MRLIFSIFLLVFSLVCFAKLDAPDRGDELSKKIAEVYKAEQEFLSDNGTWTFEFPNKNNNEQSCPQTGLRQDSFKEAVEQGRVLASLQPIWTWDCEKYNKMGHCVKHKDPRLNTQILAEKGELSPAEKRIVDAVGKLSGKGGIHSTAFLVNGRILITTAHSVCDKNGNWKSKDIKFQPDYTTKVDPNAKFGFSYPRKNDLVKIDWRNSYIGGSGFDENGNPNFGVCNNKRNDNDRSHDFAILVLEEDIFEKYNRPGIKGGKREYTFLNLTTKKPIEFKGNKCREVGYHGDIKGRYWSTEHMEKGCRIDSESYNKKEYRAFSNAVAGSSGAPHTGCEDGICSEFKVFGLSVSDCHGLGGNSKDQEYRRSKRVCGNGYVNLAENDEFRDAYDIVDAMFGSDNAYANKDY